MLFWTIIGTVFVVCNTVAALLNGYFTGTWFNGVVTGLWACEVTHEVYKYIRSKRELP